MKRILVIDDDVNVVTTVDEILSVDGFEVRKALSGDEGLALAAEERPDLFLIDLVMPGTSGFQVCKTIKNEPSLEGIPIIMLTLREGSFDPRYTKLFGVVDFLKKPLENALLREKVGEVLGVSLADVVPEEPVPVSPSEDFRDMGVPEAGAKGDGAEDSGEMFSGMEDMEGVSLTPEDSAEDAFRSPIRFDELEEVETGLDHGAAIPEGEDVTVAPVEPDDAEPEAKLPGRRTPRGKSEAVSTETIAGKASEGSMEPMASAAVESGGLSEQVQDILTSSLTAFVNDALPASLGPGVTGLVEEALATHLPISVEGVVADLVAETLPDRIDEALGGRFVESVSARLAEGVGGSLKDLVHETVRADMEKMLTGFAEDVLPAMLEEKLAAAVEAFRTGSLSVLAKEGMAALSPDLSTTVEQAIFAATDEFLSGTFEKIVADRIGAVLQGARDRRESRDVTLEGDIAAIGAAAVLAMLETELATGWLSIVGAEYVVDVQIADGRIRFASSLAAPTETRLGRILLDKKLVDEETLIAARQVGRKTGRRLGRVLVELGSLDEKDRGAALCDQTKHLCQLVLSLRAGRFLFAPGALDAEIESLPCALTVSDLAQDA